MESRISNSTTCINKSKRNPSSWWSACQLSDCPPIRLPVCQTVQLSGFLIVKLSDCQPIRLFVCLTVQPSGFPTVKWSDCLSVTVQVSRPSDCPAVLSVRLSSCWVCQTVQVSRLLDCPAVPSVRLSSCQAFRLSDCQTVKLSDY